MQETDPFSPTPIYDMLARALLTPHREVPPGWVTASVEQDPDRRRARREGAPSFGTGPRHALSATPPVLDDSGRVWRAP